MKTTYSHAAPYIREKVLRAACDITNARTLRDRREMYGRLYAYVTALRILLASPEGQTSPPEVADEVSIPHGWQPVLVGFLSETDWATLFPTLVRPQGAATTPSPCRIIDR